MTKYDDTTTLVNVGTSGAVVTFAIAPPNLDKKVSFVVDQISGDGTLHTVLLSTDPAFATPMKRIFSNAGAPDASPVAYDNRGAGYTWAPEDAGGSLSVKVTPNAGVNNSYRVRLYFF